MAFIPKNYSTDGGNELVIGGKLTVKPGAKVGGLNAVPSSGSNGQFLKKTSGGYAFSALPDAGTSTKGVVKQAAAVAGAAGDAPTKAEFDALIAALKAAGIMANS